MVCSQLVTAEQLHAHAATVVDQKVDDSRLQSYVDVALTNAIDQCVCDPRTGGVTAGVQDAGVRMGGFETV